MAGRNVGFSLLSDGEGDGCEKLLIQEEIQGGNVYVTKELVDREFEIRARQNVVEVYNAMKDAQMRQRQRMRTQALCFPSDFLNLNFSDVLRDLGNPETFPEAFAGMIQMVESRCSASARNQRSGLPPPPNQSKQVRSGEASVAEVYQLATRHQASSNFCGNLNNNHKGNLTPLTPNGKQVPFKSRTFQTPQKNPVFSFGSTNGPLSGIKKQPRQAKPGEALFTFSATGSPVMASFPLAPSTSERIKVDAGNGQMIDVDLVFRGGPVDATKKIVTDFRCWARTRTAVQSRKLNPHRPPVKKNGSLSRQQKF